MVSLNVNAGHFTQKGRAQALALNEARADMVSLGRTDRPMQSFSRLKPAPILTSRSERADRDNYLCSVHDVDKEAWRTPHTKSWDRLMGGRENFNHGKESPLDLRRNNTRSTYPQVTRYDDRCSDGPVTNFERTQVVCDPGDASSYHHQQKQIQPSSFRVGSFWYDAAKQNIDSDYARRRPLDSVWFASIRRTNHGGQRLGNLRSSASDTLDRPELFQGTPVYSNTICYGR
jgi:hypothetical protein